MEDTNLPVNEVPVTKPKDLSELRTMLEASIANKTNKRKMSKIINRSSFNLDEEVSLDVKRWLMPKLRALSMPITEFVALVGISRATLYLYFKDDIRPSIKVFQKMCEVLKCDYETNVKEIIVKKVGRPPETHFKVLTSRAAILAYKELAARESATKKA